MCPPPEPRTPSSRSLHPALGTEGQREREKGDGEQLASNWPCEGAAGGAGKDWGGYLGVVGNGEGARGREGMYGCVEDG